MSLTNPASVNRDFESCLKALAKDCYSVLEVGCAEGDNLRMLDCEKRVGIEVHEKYVRQGDGIMFRIGNALKYLPIITSNSYDLVLFIDVLEHFEKQDGLFCLRQADRIARRGIVVFTPSGFLPNDSGMYDRSLDAEAPREWSDWLLHKSGWTKEELEQDGFDVVVWDKYYTDFRNKENKVDVLFAVKDMTK